MRKKTEQSTGRYAYEGLDRIVHEKARLGIMTSLITRPDGLLFVELKQLCALTDGNLSRHMEVLREAGLVEIWKGYDRKRPQTLYRLTADGRRRFVEYLAELERVIRDARPKGARTSSTHQSPRQDRLGSGVTPFLIRYFAIAKLATLTNLDAASRSSGHVAAPCAQTRTTTARLNVKTDAEIGPDIGKLFAILVAGWQKRLPSSKFPRN